MMVEQEWKNHASGEPVLDLHEFRAIGEEISRRQNLEFREPAVNHELGAAAVVGSFGMPLAGQDLDAAIDRHLSELGVSGRGRSYAGNTGFDRNWWGERLEYEEILPFQIELTLRGLEEALLPLGAGADQLGRFGIASTTPFSMNLGEKVKSLMALPPETRAEVSAAACNSSALLFDQQLRDAKDHPGLHAIVGFETAVALRYPMLDADSDHPEAPLYSRGISDRAALSFFSDHLSVVVYDPSRFRVLARTTLGMQDERKVLGAVNTVPFEGEEVEGYDGLVRRNGNGFVAFLPDPEPEQGAFMNPRGTTEFFLRFLKTLVGDFRAKAEEGNMDISSVDHIAIHHASRPIHGKVRKLLGVSEEQAPWSSTHCNAPACTWGMEMARVLPHLKVGDRFLQVFFGAGATGQIQLLEVV